MWKNTSWPMISIHALREEGDTPSQADSSKASNFYPRPPRGGRLANIGEQAILNKISIHALREEGDKRTKMYDRAYHISIHALREEGDLLTFFKKLLTK